MHRLERSLDLSPDNVLPLAQPVPVPAQPAWFWMSTLAQATLAQGMNSITAELQGVEKIAEQVTKGKGSEPWL